MPDKWRISDSEWWIMRCTWKRPLITIKEIHAMLPETKVWNKNVESDTIATIKLPLKLSVFCVKWMQL